MLKIIGSLALALGLTVLFESCAVFLITEPRSLKKWLLAELAGNAVTNPLLNSIIILLSMLGVFYGGAGQALYRLVLGFLEIAAFLAEAVIYKSITGWRVSKCLAVSFCANFISFFLGLFIFA